MNHSIQRAAFDEAIANMSMATSPYFKDYVFYLHLLAQCKVVFTESLKAAAGVGFKNDSYVLYINTAEVIGTSGSGEDILGFTNKMPLEHRIGILKHEMLHVALGHLIRVKDGDKDFMKYNIASDCALDQEIPKEHLPSYAIYPDNNFPTKEKNILWGQTAEYYYELIDDESLQSPENEGEGPSGPGNYTIDDHSSWQEIEGDATLQQEMTKNMVEKAATETQKAKGNLPVGYGEMIDNLTMRREVDWKQILRRIVGNKKANQRKTLLRRDRRLPFANWIKGKTKDRIFELAVVSDVSGSVSDTALVELWGEVIHICDLYNTPVTLVQVDTEPSKPEPLTKQTKTVERKACGGTYLSPAITKLQETNNKFDALVITTDNYLFEDDIDPFLALKVPIIWLVEEGGGPPFEGQNSGQSRYIKLTKSDK
jgi:predicted metal-dependent peptidase